MSTNKMTIRDLLNKQLEGRAHVTGRTLTVEDLFDHDTAVLWMGKILGEDCAKKLDKWIQKASEERLSHALSTYLLGIAVRDELDIRFDLLPRLVSIGTGNAFHFFWALICLGHDLGYEFETTLSTAENLTLMKTSEGRKKLLNLSHDLFTVNGDTLKDMGIDSNGEDGQWILKSIELARKYDAMRRGDPYPGERAPVLDHGICGGLILYDVLFDTVKTLKEMRKAARSERAVRHENHAYTGALDNVTADIAQEDHSLTRFAICCMIIACTVARHNMWLANEKSEDFYKLYHLEALLPSQEAKVSPNATQEQMLFLLDFMDTIDPIKAFYTRYAEKRYSSDEEKRRVLQNHKDFMLNRVWVEFEGSACKDYRWSSALTYRKLALFLDGDLDSMFTDYTSDIAGLNGWLHTKAPQRMLSRIDLYFPACPGKRQLWPAGITDQEVDALLLYMGASMPGKFGRFYGNTEAYRTLNLLMMPGLEGEHVRVCIEKQRPDSIYIEQWKMTLEVLVDVFAAQCKYSRWNSTAKPVLYRGDRGINYELMSDNEGTIAMTSTSIGGFLPKFLEDKTNPHVLQITIGEGVPYFDYEGFFGDQYVFSEEKEVLLPPFVGMTVTEKSFDTHKEITYCKIRLHGFRPTTQEKDEYALIQELEQGKDDAVKEFNAFLTARDMDKIPAGKNYDLWKRNFQKLCHLCMENVYRAYYG